MTDRIAEIRARVEAYGGKVSLYEEDGLLFIDGRLIGQFGSSEDTAFFASAVADIRYLLAALDAAAAQQAASFALVQDIARDAEF